MRVAARSGALATGALVLACALAFALGAAAPARAAGPAELSLVDSATGQARTVSLAGSTTHVVFFATWCPACVDELERLSLLRARWDAADYRLVVVAVRTRQSADRLASFAAGRDLPVSLLFDAEGAAQRALRADALPVHILFDASGEEVFRANRLAGDFEDALSERLSASRRPRRR